MFCSHLGGRGPPGQNHGVNRNFKENGVTTALGNYCTPRPDGPGGDVAWPLRLPRGTFGVRNGRDGKVRILAKSGSGFVRKKRKKTDQRNHFRFRKVFLQ